MRYYKKFMRKLVRNYIIFNDLKNTRRPVKMDKLYIFPIKK